MPLDRWVDSVGYIPGFKTKEANNSKNALLDSPIRVESGTEAKRLRNFSFPSPSITDCSDWLATNGRANPRSPTSTLERTSEFSESIGHHRTNTTSAESGIGIESFNNEESKSEALFNKLRRYSLSMESDSNDKDSGLLDMFKTSVQQKRRKSGDSSPRRSLLSFERRGSIPSIASIGSKDDELFRRPKRAHHQRTSAMSLDKNLPSLSYFLKNNVLSNSDPLDDHQSIKELQLDAGPRRHHSLSHTEAISPQLTIENTNEQIRRNSEGHFQSLAHLKSRFKKAGPIFAGFPETGDVAPATIDLHTGELTKSYSLGSPTFHTPLKDSRPAHPTGLSLMNFSSVEEGKESPSQSSEDEELISLKEFLRTC